MIGTFIHAPPRNKVTTPWFSEMFLMHELPLLVLAHMQPCLQLIIVCDVRVHVVFLHAGLADCIDRARTGC